MWLLPFVTGKSGLCLVGTLFKVRFVNLLIFLDCLFALEIETLAMSLKLFFVLFNLLSL
jgi:hypothetical protein